MSGFFRHLLLGTVFVACCVVGSVALAQQLSFDGLQVSVVNYRWSDRFYITLALRNVTEESGAPREIAVAAVKKGWTLGSSGREPVSEVTDGTGHFWFYPDVTGLSFGENADDWLRLRPGGSVPVTFSFYAGQGSRVGPPFHFTTELKLYKYDNRPAQRVPVYFGPLGSAPSSSIYPQSQ